MSFVFSGKCNIISQSLMKIILYLREIVRKMKKILAALTLTFIAASSLAQTGTWSGRLDVSGTTLSLVFHMGDSTATLDVPDQGAKAIPVSVKRSAFGSIECRCFVFQW